jgi:mRNA interferase RelE/StbE
MKAIESLSANPAKGKPLAYDLAGLNSLRTSDYRIIYRIREKELIIIVIAVGHRREIYKKLKDLLTR